MTLSPSEESFVFGTVERRDGRVYRVIAAVKGPKVYLQVQQKKHRHQEWSVADSAEFYPTNMLARQSRTSLTSRT